MDRLTPERRQVWIYLAGIVGGRVSPATPALATRHGIPLRTDADCLGAKRS